MDMITLAMAKAYTDSQRLAYAKTERVAAMKPFTMKAGESYFEGDIYPAYEYVKVGATYIVNIGGMEYKAVSYDADGSVIAIGNRKIGGYTAVDTGECFYIEFNKEYSDWCAVGLIEAVTKDTIITVELITETIHTIDPKYLPSGSGGSGGGLPAVEIVSSGVSGLVSEEVNALLHEYAEQGTPIVAKLVIDGMGNVASSVLNYRKLNGYLMFTGDSLFDLCTTDDGVFEVRIS